MESNKKGKVLSTLVDFVGKEEFGFKELNMIIQEVIPGSKMNSISSQDLKECFGSSIISRREPSPMGHGSRMIFQFKESDDLLYEKINQYCSKKKNKLKQEIAVAVYEYLGFLPGIDSDFRKHHKSIPDIDLITKYSKILAGDTVSIDSDKFGRYKNKRLILNTTKDNFLEKYRKEFEKMFGESLSTEYDKNEDKDIVTEIIPHKDFSDMFLSRIHRDIDDRDYDITITILNMMMNAKKTGVIVTDVFVELRKNGIDSTGLNFSKWCRKEHSHFRCCNNQIQIKPGDYCESVINKKPLLSKKEKKETIVVKNEVKKVNGETFYIISPKNLKETMNLSFNKEVGNNLKAYKMTVDFSDVSSILEAYNLIIKNTVLGDEIVAKITKFVEESIAERVEKIERKI